MSVAGVQGGCQCVADVAGGLSAVVVAVFGSKAVRKVSYGAVNLPAPPTATPTPPFLILRRRSCLLCCWSRGRSHRPLRCFRLRVTVRGSHACHPRLFAEHAFVFANRLVLPAPACVVRSCCPAEPGGESGSPGADDGAQEHRQPAIQQARHGYRAGTSVSWVGVRVYRRARLLGVCV